MTAAEHPLSHEELMAYLDGELQPERAVVVHTHVAGCDLCQRLSGELRRVSQDMARWQVEDVPATLRAPSTPPEAQTVVRSRFNWLFRPSMAYGLAAASIVGIVTIATLGYGRATPASLSAAYSRTDLSGSAAGRGVTSSRADVPEAAVPEAQVQTRLSEPLHSAIPGVAGQALFAGQASTARAPGPSIARTARLRVTTADFEAARRVVDRVVADTGGLVGKVTVSTNRGDARALSATLLIPADRLDAALASLKVIGLALEETQGGDDVTSQVVDVEMRLSNARNTEKRLVDLLQKRTGNLADVLAAEREIARVREEIERFDAQRKSLDRRVTYATLTLDVIEQQHAALDLGPQPISSRFRDAFVTGITQALDGALAFALFVVRVGPVLLLWIALLGWPVWAIVRRHRRVA
jgi:hypothetical protein